jgi:hypothetical protein
MVVTLARLRVGCSHGVTGLHIAGRTSPIFRDDIDFVAFVGLPPTFYSVRAATRTEGWARALQLDPLGGRRNSWTTSTGDLARYASQ